MIIELERGRQSTLDQIRDLAARFGNRVELSEGTGVYDTVHIIGDSREFASRENYILGLPGVRGAWQPTGGYTNIARVVRGKEGKAFHRERRVVEVEAAVDEEHRLRRDPAHRELGEQERDEEARREGQ